MNLIPVVVTYLVWVAIFTTGCSRLSMPKRLVYIALIAAALLLPMFGTTPLYYLRGVFGDFSTTHAIWAVAAMISRVVNWQFFVIPQRQKLTVSLLLVTVAVCFYPSALGATDFDLYRVGFEPTALLIVLAAVSLLAWQMRQHFLLTVIVAAVFAHRFKLMESTNLWDCLFDPLLVLYCTAWLFSTALRFASQRIMQRPQPAAVYGGAAVARG